MVDDSDWGAVEASDWGTEIVHAKKVEQVDEEPKKEKKVMVVAKEMKVEKKKMVVMEIEVAQEEKDVVMQPSKKKSRNKYKTEDGKTLSRVEMMAMKRSVTEGKQEVPETKQEKPKAKKTKSKQTKQKNEGELGEPVLKKKKNEGEDEKPVKKPKKNEGKEREPIKKKEKKMKKMEKEMGEEFFGENEVEEAVEIERYGEKLFCSWQVLNPAQQLPERSSVRGWRNSWKRPNFVSSTRNSTAPPTRQMCSIRNQLKSTTRALQIKSSVGPSTRSTWLSNTCANASQSNRWWRIWDVAMRSWRRVCAIQFTRLI